MEKTMHDYLFDFAYGEALRDATLMKAFKGDKDYLKECEDGKNAVKNYIYAILNGDESPTFNDTEKSVREAFRTLMKDKGKKQEFTFGNAQKLINMTVKYTYLAALALEQGDYAKFRKKFEECHCPMDSIMCQIIKEKLDEDENEKAQEIKKKYRDGKKTWKAHLNNAWSKMNRVDDKSYPKDYECFQEIMKYLADKENLIPIEYDYKYWDNKEKNNEEQKS